MIANDASLAQQEQALTLRSQTIEEAANSLTVSNEVEYAIAASFITDTINAALKDVDRTFDDLISAAYQAHRNLIARKNEKAKPFERAKDIISRAMLNWRAQERAKEEERVRAARAEAERIARERAIEQAKQARAIEIETLITKGDVEGAQDIMEKALQGDLGPQPLPVLETVPVPVNYKLVQVKAAGVSVRTYWYFKVVDKSKIKLEYMVPDEGLIQKIVNMRKKEAVEVVGEGGIEVWSEEGIGTKGRK